MASLHDVAGTQITTPSVSKLYKNSFQAYYHTSNLTSL
jgi:hypothetical protein